MTQYATSGTSSQTLNSALPSVLMQGDEIYLFGTKIYVPGEIQKPNDSNVVMEAVAVGERSIAVSLGPRIMGGDPAGVEVRIFANADPGVSEIDVQGSSVDADGAYSTPAGSAAYKITVWTKQGAVWVGAADLQPFGAPFLSLLCVLNPNGVKFTAKVTYV